jgi:hypothetical protein
MKLRIDSEYIKKLITVINAERCNLNGHCWIYSSQGREEFKEMIVFVTLWLRLKKRDINDLYFSISAPLSAPIIQLDSTTYFQIMFKIENDYYDFLKFMDEHKNMSQLYNTLPSGSLKNISMVHLPLPHLDGCVDPSSFEASKIVTEKDIDMFCWLHDNCKGKFYRYGEMFFFEDEKDAVHFKLTINHNKEL